MKKEIDQFLDELKNASPEECIRFFVDKYAEKVIVGTSLGAEDQVLTDMICRSGQTIAFFILDTGRLFQETYDLLDITEQKYNIRMRLFFPDAGMVEEMVAKKGINLFYSSIENRRLCCNIRKIEPLKRALSGMKVWITGLRKDQSVTRSNVKLVEWDETYSIIKLNPLINWSEKQVWDYIKSNHVPYNELHDSGNPSIGCRPCTRPILPGEETRAGRWWWELAEYKECGLHRKE